MPFVHGLGVSLQIIACTIIGSAIGGLALVFALRGCNRGIAGLARGFHTSSLHGGGGLLDTYWAQYYLLNYRDGFHHRAVIGSLLRAISPNGISVFVIDAIAIAALAVMVGMLLQIIRRALSTDASPLRIAAASILLSSCMLSVLVETLGDLLQICFVLVAAAFVLCLRLPSRAVAAAVAVVTTILCLQIHEASLLLLAPALLFAVTRGKVRLPAVVLTALLIAVLFGWNALQNNAHGHLTYVGRTFPHHGIMQATDEVNKGFRELRQEERRVFFASNKLRALWVVRFGGVFLPAFAAVLSLAYLLPRARFRNYVALFTTLFAISLPVYAVAHDWPRFLSLTFLLAFVAEDQLFRHALTVQSPLAGAFMRMADRMRVYAVPVSTVIALTLLLLLASEGDYRYWGMPAHLFLPLVPLLLVCLVLSRNAAAQCRDKD